MPLQLYISGMVLMTSWLRACHISNKSNYKGLVSSVPSWFSLVNFIQHDWQARWCGTIAWISHQGWGCFVCAQISWLWLSVRRMLSAFQALPFILGTKQTICSAQSKRLLQTPNVGSRGRWRLALYHTRAHALRGLHAQVLRHMYSMK